MEDSKKSKIVDTAIELFRIKGYSAASMQDIAEACGMAKASIYKLFDSKEQLFTAAFVVCHRTLLEQAGALDREGANHGLSPKMRLIRKIEFQLQYALENHLLMIDFKEEPIASNEHFIAAWKTKKNALLAWYRELLLEAYGSEIDPYIWDIVAIFRGIHNIYLMYVRQKVVALPMSDLAAFIVDRIDAVIEDLIEKAPKSIIGWNNMQYNGLNPSDLSVRADTVRQLFGLLDEKIRKLPKTDGVREELGKVAVMLKEACEAKPSDSTLVRVLGAYLDGEPELRPYMRQLHYLMS
ncbi:TetR/AcrR family transcriptional regulator [Cohnella terricola]|uniref:TetR/AcrR family transcriptional regulator n=1 Tax=Cohnella terricola TaxID=1289167 RepID=A0A559JQ85_9BACL|nr:TetR/AcrR family transcriptional regulator [Cohnella terricola]TVY02018.1 TetR/AcrR family transcriptional regulator [Cohnella terricola]